MTNKYLAEYNREVRRLKQAIRRAEKKGYTVPSNIIPPKPQKITAGSVRRLAKITPEKIRQKSASDVILAKPTKAKLNAQLKKDKEQRKKITQKTQESLKKIQENEDYREKFSKGEIVYRKILDLLEKYAIENPKAVQVIKGILNDEISQFGKGAVMESLAQNEEDILETVEYAMHYPINSPQSNNALYEITMLIEGDINLDTLVKLNKAIEEDENWEDIDESEWGDLFGN